MNIDVIPFDQARHLDAAADLLADRHRRDRERDPRLPGAFEVPAAARSQIESAFNQQGWHGVVASTQRQMAGFAIMAPQLFPPTHMLASFFPARGVSLGYGWYASVEGSEYDVYRAMYAFLAEHFVRAGFFDHSISIPATNRDAQEAFVSLGFGRNMACAVRDVSPTARAASSAVDLHQASGEDAEVIFDLSEELTMHHARSPIFNPFIREADPSGHDFQRNLLNEPETNAHWIGYMNGKPIGMNTFMAPFFPPAMVVPEKTVYLFQGIVTGDARAVGVGTAILSKGVEWARERGFEHVALHFASANLSGAKFWQSSGFKPIEYGMRRHIDERIAWANR